MTGIFYKHKFRSFEAMIRYARRYNSPPSGCFAAMVWELFSGATFTPKFSQEMYMKMGYVPFVGYPLQRIK